MGKGDQNGRNGLKLLGTGTHDMTMSNMELILIDDFFMEMILIDDFFY
jgi:hypothetical protein